MDARGEEHLVGVDVADAGHGGLVEQRGLDAEGSMSGQLAGEDGCVEERVEWLGAHPRQQRILVDAV